jgi:hypothetical protein
MIIVSMAIFYGNVMGISWGAHGTGPPRGPMGWSPTWTNHLCGTVVLVAGWVWQTFLAPSFAVENYAGSFPREKHVVTWEVYEIYTLFSDNPTRKHPHLWWTISPQGYEKKTYHVLKQDPRRIKPFPTECWMTNYANSGSQIKLRGIDWTQKARCDISATVEREHPESHLYGVTSH